MGLSTGTRLGPYEITGSLGAGGMGEVYRARDTRVDREVALKVLPGDFLEGEEGRARRERFEREARLLASLNHPNIAVLYSFEEISGRHVLAMELLEGESLRGKLGAPVPPRRAVEIAVHIAHGLAAAHEKSVVHRDLKPENVFVTKDGRIKLLDFGIAKLTQPTISSAPLTEAPTETPATGAGVVLGTVGYMSPEQVLGKTLDARSDLFSLGVVFYEMLSGKRPFHKDSAPETMTAILREEPPDLGETGRNIPPGLDRIVRHCLEKEPSARFQSAHDVAFALESLSQATTGGAAPLRGNLAGRRRAAAALAILSLFAVGAGAFFWGVRTGRTPVPTFKRITLRRGLVTSAFFTPDFQSVVYGAQWEGRPSEVFVQRLASADARPLGLGADVVGSAGGDVAVLRQGVLARLPLEGGTPRDILEGVVSAAWDRTGARFAIVRERENRHRLEFPAGNVLLETTAIEGIGSLRISSDGRQIAFIFYPNRDDLSGDVCVLDAAGRRKTLSPGWTEITNLAWTPDGKEIWFSATKVGAALGLHAVTLAGKERLLTRLPGSVEIQDIAPGGRVLATFGQARRNELRGRMAGDRDERDLSWLDGAVLPILSPDGTQMVFQEWGEGGGVETSTYHWQMDTPTPKRLSDGASWDVSPDWKRVLVGVGLGEKLEAKLVPIGAGETTTIPRGPIRTFSWGVFHPDGKRLVILGSDTKGQTRLFVLGLDGGEPRPLVDAVWGGFRAISPDGRFIPVKTGSDAPWRLQPIDGGDLRPIPFLSTDERPLRFSGDGESLFFFQSFHRTVSPFSGRFPLHITRLNLRTGTRQPWLELAPPDRAGIQGSLGFQITPNGRYYAYGYTRILSDLYLMEGLP